MSLDMLNANLAGIAGLLRKDWDWLHICTGYEGSGKSTLALQMCLAVDPAFNAGRVCFTADEFMRAVDTSKKYQAILCDEGSEFLLSRNAMTKDSKDAVKLFTQMRSKNLFVVICIPSIDIIDSYVRDHRIRSMTRIVRRGAFEFYNGRQCKMIRKDPKTNQLVYPQPSFFDGFGKFDGRLWTAYLQKKRAFRARIKNPFYFEQLDKYHARLEKSMTFAQVAKICNVHILTIKRWNKTYRIFPKKCLFIDWSGRFRVTNAGYKTGMARLKKMREKAYKRGPRGHRSRS